jgi:fibronectin-binding autotransporter adhesin
MENLHLSKYALAPFAGFALPRAFFAALTFIALSFLAASDAQAGDRVWNGGGTATNVNWSLTANWGASGTPNGNDSFTFAGTTSLTNTNNLTVDGVTNVNTFLVFTNTAGAFVLNGTNNTADALILTSAGALTNLSTNTQTINFGMTFRAAAGTNSVDTANGSIILNGIIAGTNITKVGAATLFLNGTNTFSGVLSNSAGAIRVGNNSGLGTTNSGTVIVSGAALELTTNNAGGNISIGAEALSLAGTGINSAGALRNITGSNSYGGLLTLTNATRINSDGGTLTLTNTGTITGATFALTLGGAGNLTINSIIGTTTGTVTKDGAGTLILGAANTYTGDTIAGAGVVRLSGSGSIAAASGVVVSNGATFDFNSISDTVDGISGAGAVTLGSATLTVSNSATNNFSGALSGTGGLVKVGAGTQILSGTTNSYGGTTTIGAGVLSVSNLANAGVNSSIGTNGTIIITNSGVLEYRGSTVSIDRSINLAGAAGVIGVTNSATSLTIAGAITNTGSLVKTNAGELILTGANTYSGTTTVGAGVLNIQNNAGLGATNSGTTVISGAALELEGGVTIGAEALTLNGTGISVAGALRSISGNNTYGGLITLGSASEISSDSGTLSITNAGTISGATFGLTLGGAGNLSIASIIGTTSGTLIKEGAGTATLSGASTYTGATTISNGVLRIANSAGLGATNGGSTVRSGAALELSNGISVGAETLSIAGTGISSGGALRNISGANTYGGLLTLTNATRINSDSGTLTLTNTGTISGATFGLTLGGAGDIVLNSVIGTTTGTLTKDGAGTVRLGAINTYGGVTTVGDGVLRVTNVANAGTSSAIGTNATITITNGGVLDYAGTTNSSMNRGINLASGNGGIGVSNSAAALTISGVISNSGTLVKSGAGTLILSASNNYSGGTILNLGTLVASNLFAFGTNSITLNAGLLNLSSNSIANLIINNGGTLTNLGTVSGAELNGGTTTLSASNSTVAEVSGTAIVNVAGNNTTISNVTGGTISVAGTNTTLQSVNDGTLNVAGANTTVETLSGGAVNVTNGRSVVVRSGSSSNAIAGGGALIKNGASSLTLSGNNTFNGGTFLNEGILRLASTSAAGGGAVTQSNGSSRLVIDTSGNVANQMSVYYLQSLQTVTLSGNKTLNNATYDIASSTTTTESGTLSGSGGITKLGTGTLIVTASNTFTGAVDVQAGLLNLNSATGSAAGGTASVGVATNATLLISQNNQVNNTAAVSLSGGTIRTASGVSEVFGDLTVTGSGFLDFGTTSYANANTINFGTYTPSALLTINNFDYGSTLTFGSDLTSTINNSSFFTFNNGGIANSSWNAGTSTFTITAIPETSTYVAAIGLLAMMLWPLRRRLLKDARSILGLRAPMRDRLAGKV